MVRVMRMAGVAALMQFYHRLDRYRSFDWAMRAPIVCYTLGVLGWDVWMFHEQVAAQPAVFAHPDNGMIVATLARVCQWMFVGILAALQLTRMRPVAKSEDILPRLGALVASCITPFFLLLQRAPPSFAFNLASVLIGLAASIMSVVTVSFLGRSLSIMPEARRLVTRGPYALVRHPLYVCEILGGVASVLIYRSIAVFAIFFCMVALQMLRGRWEERVLQRAFPDYAAYRARTPFLVPRHPLRFAMSYLADPLLRRRSIAVVVAAVALDAAALTLVPRLFG
jgi:protein-S-isoprenylcysteine O-methyltransferase Ste14